MAYFLKKVNRNGKVYLSIVDSFYDGSRGHTVHKTHSSYGTGEKLKPNSASMILLPIYNLKLKN